LLETKQYPSPANISHTSTPQVQTKKRARKEVSPLVTKVSNEYFQVYRKRKKTSHTPDMFREGETQSTIVMEGPHSSTFSGKQHIVSTSSSKKQVDTTLSVESSHEPTRSSIFYKYKMIKQRNEILNRSTYDPVLEADIYNPS
jgi:hypothetical protein